MTAINKENEQKLAEIQIKADESKFNHEKQMKELNIDLEKSKINAEAENKKENNRFTEELRRIENDREKNSFKE